MTAGAVDCAFVRGCLPLFPGPELTPADDGAVRAHLADCRSCQRELRGWLDVRAAFGAATGPEVPPAGGAAPDEGALAQMQDEVLDRIAVERGTPRRRNAHFASAVAAAVLFVAGVGVVSLVPHARPRLLDLDRFEGSQPPARDSSATTRPVAMQTWTGLRGRELADAFLRDSVGDVTVRTLPAPFRDGEVAEDGEGRADATGGH